jgi:hypothetical protein
MILIYVSYMFDKLLVGVKSNHVVMEQDFQHCTIIELLSCTFGYACLSDVKWVGVIMLKIQVCIFVREDHWATN